MRCKNCGWENPTSLTKCEKCNEPLAAEQPEILKSTVREEVAFSEPIAAPNVTSCPKCGYPVSNDMDHCPNCNANIDHPSASKKSVCPNCNKEYEEGAKFCPSCGTPLSSNTSAEPHATAPRRINRPSVGGTVISGLNLNIQQNTFCQLRRIAWQGEDTEYGFETYSGSDIVLNRANTDPNNNSITSAEQAVLTKDEDGNWYVENRSALKSTYIRVNGKVKIQSGDIIVLGNREFEFKG